MTNLLDQLNQEFNRQFTYVVEHDIEELTTKKGWMSFLNKPYIFKQTFDKNGVLDYIVAGTSQGFHVYTRKF